VIPSDTEPGEAPTADDGPRTPARIGFFVGKGGVGKSTLASAEAVRAALAGQRVLVVSTDQAHSLGDVLGVAVRASGDADPVRILTEERGGQTGGGHLDAAALDTLALLASMWRAVAPALALRFPSSDLNELAPEELCALPGIQEVLGLRAVADLADSGRWDYVVVDCASTADALRMLTMPAAFAEYVERCWPRHRRLSATVEDVRTAATVALVETVSIGVESLAELLKDGFLAQNAFDEKDQFCSPARQAALLQVISQVYRKSRSLIEAGVALGRIRELPALRRLIHVKTIYGNEEIAQITALSQQIQAELDGLVAERGAP
jgi:anion-transporting  ArsA/GET3 family ATPase